MFVFLGEQCSERLGLKTSLLRHNLRQSQILKNSMTDLMDCISPYSNFPDSSKNKKLFPVLVLHTAVVQRNQSVVNSQLNHQSVILCMFLVPDQYLFLQKMLYQNVNNSGGLDPKLTALHYGRCFLSLKLKWPSNIIPQVSSRQTPRHNFLFYKESNCLISQEQKLQWIIHSTLLPEKLVLHLFIP